MTNLEMLSIVKQQLAVDLNCSAQDLDGEKDSFVFCEARDNPGRRPFPRDARHVDVLTMGKAIVVSTPPGMLPYVKEQLCGQSRDDAFFAPFLYGHSLYYLPDLNAKISIAPPPGFTYEIVKRDGIGKLYEEKGFENALSYDMDHPRPDVIAIVAKRNGEIAAMAGASADCAQLWQIGIDTRAAYRGHGLAAYLVRALSGEILRLGYVPYYGTASSNIPSQKVAHRAGFMPAWMCSYKLRS